MHLDSSGREKLKVIINVATKSTFYGSLTLHVSRYLRNFRAQKESSVFC